MNKQNPGKVLDELIEETASGDPHTTAVVLQAHYMRLLCDNVHTLQKSVEELDRTIYNLKVYVGG